MATFFTGWDWNGDGKNDWGISLHAKVNEQGFFHFLTLAGALRRLAETTSISSLTPKR